MKFSNFKITHKEKNFVSGPITFAEVDVTRGLMWFKHTETLAIFLHEYSWKWGESGACIRDRRIYGLGDAHIAKQKLAALVASEAAKQTEAALLCK